MVLALPAAAALAASPEPVAQGTGGQDIPDLMENKHCDYCHHETERRSGPPYSMIATMYADRDRGKSMDKLVKKILEGGMGTWGIQPMPPGENVSPEQARAMARWILDLK